MAKSSTPDEMLNALLSGKSISRGKKNLDFEK
jgi:hypothetical protein